MVTTLATNRERDSARCSWSAVCSVGTCLAAELDEVLTRFDEVQDSISTLSAEFTETTTNQLLIDPILAEGRFFMTKPDSIRWEYSFPEEMRFVIFQDQYTGYFPKQKRAEKRNIQRWSEHIFRFFGLGQGSQELMKFYEITLDPTHDSGERNLPADPRADQTTRPQSAFPRSASGSTPTTYLPRKVEYRSKSGNARTDRVSGDPPESRSRGLDVPRGHSGRRRGIERLQWPAELAARFDSVAPPSRAASTRR